MMHPLRLWDRPAERINADSSESLLGRRQIARLLVFKERAMRPRESVLL